MDAVDPNDATLAAYDREAARYVSSSAKPAGAVLGYLDRFSDLVGAGAWVLELGSGPGWDADHLERRGLTVERTDGTPSLVACLRATGPDARVLDVRSDDFGGPFDAVLADAVLLHLSREQFDGAAVRAAAAVRAGGHFGLTLKEGDGAAWVTEKITSPRHFTYWQEPALRTCLEGHGWTVVSCERAAGRRDDWLLVICQLT